MNGLNKQELALVLAGLRHLQSNATILGHWPIGAVEILEAGNACAMTGEDIDALCEKLNVTEPEHTSLFEKDFPFETPIHISDGKFLIANDLELILQADAHTSEELDAIVKAVNAHTRILDALVDCHECIDAVIDIADKDDPCTQQVETLDAIEPILQEFGRMSK